MARRGEKLTGYSNKIQPQKYLYTTIQGSSVTDIGYIY